MYKKQKPLFIFLIKKIIAKPQAISSFLILLGNYPTSGGSISVQGFMVCGWEATTNMFACTIFLSICIFPKTQ